MKKIRNWWRRANQKKIIESTAHFIGGAILTASCFLTFCGAIFIIDTFKDNVWQTTPRELFLILASSYLTARYVMVKVKYREVNEKYRTLLEADPFRKTFIPKNKLKGKEIIGGGERCGKTHYLIARSNMLKIPIMTATHQQAVNITLTADHLGIKIPEPVTAHSIRHMQGNRNNTVLVDEIEMVLGSLTGVKIETASSSYNLVRFGGVQVETGEKADSGTV